MKSINLLALPGATEFNPARRNRTAMAAAASISSSPEATTLIERVTDGSKAERVSKAMHGLLDTFVDSDFRFTRHRKENPMLYAHNVGQPALVGALRVQAGVPVGGEEPESWRLLLNRFSGQEPASVIMSYTVYLGGDRWMRNGLDVRVLSDQVYAGNGELADRQINNMPVDITEVPGVADAIIEDLATLRKQNDLQ